MAASAAGNLSILSADGEKEPDASASGCRTSQIGGVRFMV